MPIYPTITAYDQDTDIMSFELLEDDPDTSDAYLIDEIVGALAVAKLLKNSNFSFK